MTEKNNNEITRRLSVLENEESKMRDNFNALQMDLVGKINEVLRLIQATNNHMEICQATRPCQKKDIYSTPPNLRRSTLKGRVSILVGTVVTLIAALAAAISEYMSK